MISGPEMGPEHQGQPMIIHKGLYRLCSSSARFHEHLSKKLILMGYKPSVADQDLWLKDRGTHYEYIVRYIDDILAFGKDPIAMISELQKDYVLKGIGQLEYYLGSDICELDETWHVEGIKYTISVKTYCTNIIKKYEQLLNGELCEFNMPMASDYHPELDTSEFLDERTTSIYQGLIGSANWMVSITRFDIAHAMNTMARYGVKPREGHLQGVKHVFGYIKKYPQGQLILDTNDHDWSQYKIEDYNWSDFYPNAIEELPHSMPEPKGKEAKITCYKDADHAFDQVTH